MYAASRQGSPEVPTLYRLVTSTRPASHISSLQIGNAICFAAFCRVAMPPSPWGGQLNLIAVTQHILAFGIDVFAIDTQRSGSARLTAFDSERRETRALGEKRHGDR